jgi:hypothetical protein
MFDTFKNKKKYCVYYKYLSMIAIAFLVLFLGQLAMAKKLSWNALPHVRHVINHLLSVSSLVHHVPGLSTSRTKTTLTPFGDQKFINQLYLGHLNLFNDELSDSIPLFNHEIFITVIK